MTAPIQNKGIVVKSGETTIWTYSFQHILGTDYGRPFSEGLSELA